VEIDESQNNNLVIAKKFVWCGTELCEERDATGATVTKRFFGQGEQIAGTNYFFTRDHLGSVREMTDSSGTIQARYDYDPYGRRTKVQGDLDADSGFTGHYFHAVSGLHLALYRAYDADMGRWLNRDPLSEAGGLNLYDYVGNSPINAVDLYGTHDAVATTIETSKIGSEAMTLSTVGTWTIGNNASLYTSGWGGNQYVTTMAIKEGTEVFGHALTVVGIGYDLYEAGTCKESWGQAGANIAVSGTAWALGASSLEFGGPMGVALSSGYLVGSLIEKPVNEAVEGVFQSFTDWYYGVDQAP